MAVFHGAVVGSRRHGAVRYVPMCGRVAPRVAATRSAAGAAPAVDSDLAAYVMQARRGV